MEIKSEWQIMRISWYLEESDIINMIVLKVRQMSNVSELIICGHDFLYSKVEETNTVKN